MPFIRLAVLVLRNKTSRNLLIATVAGFVFSVAFLLIIVSAAVASIFDACRDEQEGLSDDSAPISEPSQDAISDIPEDYLELYQEAGEDTGVDWAVIAAVGKQESGHGQDAGGCATSEDGAQGPMQFIPSTWSQYGDGGDPCDPEDAIPAAGSYLADLGAAEDPEGALCDYYGRCADENANYTEEVMAQAEAYRSDEEDRGAGDESGGGDSPEEDPGSAPGTIPLLISPAYAQASTPAGWSLVEPDKTMTYYSDTRFDSYLEAAVEEWNALGGVDIQPADSEEEANVVVYDGGSLDWAMGYTETTDAASNKGTIEINEQKVSEVATETNRKSVMVHELGHTLGFEHQNDKESVMNQNLNTDVPTEMDVEIYRETWGGEGSPADADPADNYGEEETSEECHAGFWPWS